MEHQWRQRLESLSALGSQTQLLEPRIELCANRQAVIEGCAGILEYSETQIKLNCKTLVLTLCGTELCLNSLSSSQICVSGNILSLSFVSA